MRLGIAIAAAAVGMLFAAPTAGAFIYWSAYDSGNSKIGRADADGGNVNPELVKGIYFGQGVATDGSYVYWGESGSSPKLAQVGRAGIDGSSPDHAFQQGATYCGIFDVAATTDLFWLKSDCSGLEFGWDIDRTALAGGGGAYTEVGAGSFICGFDVDANYVYWSEKHFIARAPLPGPTLPDREWLDVGTGVSPCAVAVDSGHVYWTTLRGEPTFRGTDIGRADLSGNESSVQNAFITGASFTNANGIDVADGFIYWTNRNLNDVNGSIGRASVDGTGVAQFFVSPLFNPNSIDVDGAGPKPAPPGSQGSGPPPLPPHPAPVLAGVSSSHSSFAPGGASTSTRFRPMLSAGASKAVPRGTVFSYRLDQSAAVTIEIEQKNGGRMVRGRCQARRKANARKKKCDLVQHVLKGNGRAGGNQVPYSGRVKGRALKPGAYRAVFIATSAGAVSKPVSVGFTIVKP